MTPGRTVARGLAVACALSLAACATAPKRAPRYPPPTRERPAPAPPGEYYQVGTASWYGPGFDGRRTASGEVFDQDAMTAAHRTLPFGTILQVTNLDNGRVARVRVNDRGPFIEGRILDCSRGSAEALGFRIAGLARVALAIEGQEVREARTGREVLVPVRPEEGDFDVQVGAFREEANARRLRDRLAEEFPRVFLTRFRDFLRVRVGPASGEAAAERYASRLREMGYTPFVTRHDPGTEVIP